jgi:hypothetical protein
MRAEHMLGRDTSRCTGPSPPIDSSSSVLVERHSVWRVVKASVDARRPVSRLLVAWTAVEAYTT